MRLRILCEIIIGEVRIICKRMYVVCDYIV